MLYVICGYILTKPRLGRSEIDTVYFMPTLRNNQTRKARRIEPRTKPVIMIRLGGVLVPAHLDTGSDHTVVSVESTLNGDGIWGAENKSKYQNDLTLHGGGGGSLNCTPGRDVTLQLGRKMKAPAYNVTVNFLKQHSAMILLGMDVMMDVLRGVHPQTSNIQATFLCEPEVTHKWVIGLQRGRKTASES